MTSIYNGIKRLQDNYMLANMMYYNIFSKKVKHLRRKQNFLQLFV